LVGSYIRVKANATGNMGSCYVCYGSGNRSVLVRIPEIRRAIRFRGADGTCNPYLLAASLVAAGLYGITKRIDPGEPVDIDVDKMNEVELQERLGFLEILMKQSII